jgi:hypothetical protein
MLRYGTLIATAILTALPAHAQQMNAHEARSFVVGKLFSYQCFEGTRGAGRIMENGGVAGTIQFRGNGVTRYAALPQNTIRVVGDRVCAQVKGLPFQPCFNIVRTSHNSFRGSVSGMGFAYCDFVRRERGDRPMVASVEPRRRAGEPMELHTGSARAAFPKPIDSSDLPPVADEASGNAQVAPTKPVEARAAVEPVGTHAVASEAKAAELSAAATSAEAKSVDVSAAADDKPALRPTKD